MKGQRLKIGIRDQRSEVNNKLSAISPERKSGKDAKKKVRDEGVGRVPARSQAAPWDRATRNAPGSR